MDGFTFHHVGIAVLELQPAAADLEDLFGYKMISSQFDDPIQKVSVCFLSQDSGGAAIELVAPLGLDSPMNGTVRKRSGPYHICYQVPDIDVAIAYLTAKGCFLISGPVPAVAFEMRKIAWLMTELKLLVELLEE